MNKTLDLNQELTLFTPSGTLLKFQGLTGTIVQPEEKPLNCYLTLQVSFEQYQLIEQEHLFNLKPEVCSPLIERQFNSEIDLTLELMLKPGLVPQLTQEETPVTAILTELEQSPPEKPPLHQLTESWYCLSVQQQQDDKTIGYRTLWNWANPETLKELFKTGKQEFQGWGEQIQTALDSLGNRLSQFTITFPTPDAGISVSLSQVMTDFFDADDWDYVRLEDGVTLETSFIGENGRWNCLAKAREAEQQFLFYSICPVATPEDQRSQMAEFLTKANCGLILGNFELDYADGEVCYKTSIDVEGDRLTPALIESLVYTNVTMMDQYLPSIIAVVNGLSPDDAIAKVETDALTDV